MSYQIPPPLIGQQVFYIEPDEAAPNVGRLVPAVVVQTHEPASAYSGHTVDLRVPGPRRLAGRALVLAASGPAMKYGLAVGPDRLDLHVFGRAGQYRAGDVARGGYGTLGSYMPRPAR